MTGPRRRAHEPEPPPGPPWDGPVAAAPLVFVDLEMTGLRPATDRVIELCAERFQAGELVARIDTLVRPSGVELGGSTTSGARAEVGNVHVHGIRAEELAAAPTFDEIAPTVEAVLEGGIVVAHAAEYDVAFLEAELARAGRPRSFPFFLDTLTLSRRAFAFQSHSLTSLCTELGIARVRLHRASDDVAALREVFRRALEVLAPTSPRDLWHVRVGSRKARPEVVAAAVRALESEHPVHVRYRPSKKPPEDLTVRVTQVRTDLDPPRVLGYLLPSRGRRELRADRILSIEAPDGTDEPRLDQDASRTLERAGRGS